MIRRHLLKAALMCVCFSGASAAQADNIAMPTSAWLIGPSVIDKDPQMNESEVPCIMANQFSNGAFVRISVLQNNVIAMAVTKTDFAKSLTGDENVTLQIDTGSDGDKTYRSQAKALNNDTFIISLSDQEFNTQILAEAQKITINVADMDLQFSPYGIGDGLRRVQNCAGVSQMVQNEPDMRSARPVKPSPAKKDDDTELSAMMDDALKVDKKLHSDHSLEQRASQKGVHVISKRLAGHWTQPLPDDTDNQTHEAAELAAPPMTDVLAPMPPVAANVPAPISSPVSAQPVHNSAPAQAPPQYSWAAVRGASLRETLFNWSRNINAQLIWRAPKQPVVETSNHYQGTYEAAVSSILEDFNNRGFNFKATIYPDFSTGNIILLVE